MAIIDNFELSIYDMYVMNNSGIPIFAGCTTSDYCMQHMDQHPLHTGFIAAMLSFGKEVFSGDLQKLTFPKVNLNLRTVREHTFVMVNPDSLDDDLVQNKLDMIVKLFEDKYEKNVDSFYITDEQTNNFTNDMIRMGLIPKDRLQSTKHYFVSDTGKSQEKSSTLISRFKQKFSSLVKK